MKFKQKTDLEQNEMNPYKKHAEFINQLTYSFLSESIIHAAKRMLLDAFGCMAAGSRLTESTIHLPSGGCTIIGRKGRYSREWATFANGVHMVSTEMDEGNQFAKGHPLAHFLPSLLAESETMGASGKDFLLSLVMAYEITTRWGSAVSLRKEVHPHGNWGTVGAAAAVVKLRGYQLDHIIESLILANSLPMTSAWTSALTGATVRNGYIGACNVMGLMAPDMVSFGVRSNETVLDQVYSGILGQSLDKELLDQELGKEFFIEKNYMKIYSCCRFIHGAVDVLEGFKKEGVDLKPEFIESVKVETYQAASMLNSQEVPNGFAAKFSIPVSLAIWFCRKGTGQEHFTDENVSDEEIRSIASKINVVEDPQLTSLLPSLRATRVTVKLVNGLEFSGEVSSATGDYTNPLTDEQLIEKFISLASPVLGKQRCEEIINIVFSLEQESNISPLLDKLSLEEMEITHETVG